MLENDTADRTEQAEERTRETQSFMRSVRRATRRKYTPEEKIRIVLEGFRRHVIHGHDRTGDGRRHVTAAVSVSQFTVIVYVPGALSNHFANSQCGDDKLPTAVHTDVRIGIFFVLADIEGGTLAWSLVRRQRDSENVTMPAFCYYCAEASQ